jgi:hypothetical protein
MSASDQDDQRDASAAAPSPQSGGTGGGGNAARDKAPVATAEAPTPDDLPDQARKDGGTSAARGGAASGLQPGGTKPSTAPLAGQGRIGTGGGSSGGTGDAG